MKKTLKEFLESKEIKDISKDFEGATTEEMHSYYVAKLEFEQLELKGRLEVIETGNTEEVEKAKSEIATLKEAIKLQGTTLKAIQTGQLSGSTVNGLENSIDKALKANLDNFTKSKTERNHDFSFTIDKVVDMTFANSLSGGNMPQAQRLEGINDIAERITVTYPSIPKLTTDRNTIEWVYETSQDGTIAGTAEGASKDQIDNTFVVSSVSLEKTAAFFKVSTEMLDDVSFMAGWLRNKLIVRLLLSVDNQCLNGDGSNNTVNGLMNQAIAFAPGTFATGQANAVENANAVDVLVVAMNQIKLLNQGVSNLTIQMNPTNVAALKMIKVLSSATDNRYVTRLLQVGSTLMLDGVPILENNNMAVGSYLVYDSSKATIVEKSSIMVEVGLDGSDFTKNMRTILAEWRGQLFIQNNDLNAFVTGVFATDAAAIEKA